ncbi:hypothetical protein [Carnobacterium maltaromaticum]|jgi:hypothetical protein|uniref:Membrane protein n=1 Tax=Carnobacterium maltaromaticum LMA28 TaxID=1234679 RepID=K8EF71_CARML|nr:hypothetical protein [Carnobacterium maltaromaticum]AOA01390.1 hypothetical protein BFC23_02175 [Carnobacterium maltaromaticum]MCI1819200.1 hypothetical protein [Carnobacterium maltaromaticum]CCO10438.2 putative membrane protein [Carnobacterium maltaromaticum LMA28]
MKIKKTIKENLILRIVLYLLIGIPVGLLMIDNEIVLGLGMMLLFLTALKPESSKKRKRKNKI